jgi:hypothetical protein
MQRTQGESQRQRRACRAIGVERNSVRYRSRHPDDGADLPPGFRAVD